MAGLSVESFRLLADHPGVRLKSSTGQCMDELFSGSFRGTDSSEVLNATVAVELGIDHIEGNLFTYRECGKTACRRECGLAIDAQGTILDAAPFVAPCTGKIS